MPPSSALPSLKSSSAPRPNAAPPKAARRLASSQGLATAPRSAPTSWASGVQEKPEPPADEAPEDAAAQNAETEVEVAERVEGATAGDEVVADEAENQEQA